MSDRFPSECPFFSGVTMNTHDLTHFSYRAAPSNSSAAARDSRAGREEDDGHIP